MSSSSSRVSAPARAPVSSSSSRQLSPVASLREHGLLAGVGAPERAAYYSPHLSDLLSSGALLTARGLLWAAAAQDATARGKTTEVYIADVHHAAAAFFRRDQLFDRADTMHKLGKLMGEGEGEFVLFLGSSDFGKSLMLRELASRMPEKQRRVLLVNARDTGADLAEGIVTCIKSDRAFFASLIDSMPGRLCGVAAALADIRVPGSGPSVSAALAPLSGDHDLVLDLLRGFVSACEKEGTYPLLLVDEANLALPSAPGVATPARTLGVLHLLTRLTKESRRMNVLLAASEHAEPFRLAQLGFKTRHITQTVVACEVPPSEMRVLLTQEWHCGPALAEGLMAIYGGHVWQTRLALSSLAHNGPDFAGIEGFSPASCDGVLASLRAARSGELPMAGLEGMLRALAVHGHTGISDRSDPRAELVSKLNVGGVVSTSASAPGLPPEVRFEAGASQLLVATSHSTRLLLALELSRPVTV